MTLPRRLVADLDAAIAAHLAPVVARLDAIEARMGRHPRDGDDRRVVAALASAIGRAADATRASWPDRITARAVRDLAGVDADLRRALVLADATSTRSIGRLLSRVEGHVIDGWRVDRLTPPRARLAAWRLVAVSAVCNRASSNVAE